MKAPTWLEESSLKNGHHAFISMKSKQLLKELGLGAIQQAGRP